MISSTNDNNKHNREQIDSNLTVLQYCQKFSKRNKIKYENKPNGTNKYVSSTFK